MNFIEAAIFILLFAILSVPIANRLHFPLEIFLVIGSCLLSLVPGLPNLQINPIIVFNLFLPPILFYAAYFTSWHDFKFNLRPISLLAFGLVLFTTVVVAWIAKMVFPDFSWAEGFLLGAIVSPTDAASATTIIKKLGAPRRLITVLEGESLVNDATALILFSFALVAIINPLSFSLPHAVTKFIFISAGGVLIGLGIGYIAELLLQRIKSIPAETTFTFITAFACYFIGEFLHVSGVITTVACGIYFGIRFPQLTSSYTRINAKASWNTLIFIINGFVFTLIGLELPSILKNFNYHTIISFINYGIIISLAVIIVRIIWVYPAAHLSRLLFPAIARKDPTPSWKVLFILSWSGMRGIVSLAAALSLPYFITHRDLFIFITYCVVIFTLLIPTFTLPLILRLFKLVDSEDKMHQEALARIRSLEEVMKRLENITQEENIPEDIRCDYRKHLEQRFKIIETQLNDMPYSTLNNEYQALTRLALIAIDTERQTLFKLRKSGEIHDEVFHLLSDELDLEEMRARTIRI